MVKAGPNQRLPIHQREHFLFFPNHRHIGQVGTGHNQRSAVLLQQQILESHTRQERTDKPAFFEFRSVARADRFPDIFGTSSLQKKNRFCGRKQKRLFFFGYKAKFPDFFRAAEHDRKRFPFSAFDSAKRRCRLRIQRIRDEIVASDALHGDHAALPKQSAHMPKQRIIFFSPRFGRRTA